MLSKFGHSSAIPQHYPQIIDFEDIFNHINTDDNNFMSHY